MKPGSFLKNSGNESLECLRHSARLIVWMRGYASSWTLAGTGGQMSWKQQSIQSSDRENDPPFGITPHKRASVHILECTLDGRQSGNRSMTSLSLFVGWAIAGLDTAPAPRAPTDYVS